MGEITDYVNLYIENSGIIEETTKEVSHALETNIKNVIAPGKVGYDTGSLHDSIQSNHAIHGKVGIVIGWYSKEHGKYWYRWKGGKDFLKVGLEETMKLYG